MPTLKNPNHILAAAKTLRSSLSPLQEMRVSMNTALQKPLNETIIQLKAFMEKRHLDRSYTHIGEQKKLCLSKGLLSQEELSGLHTVGQLLDILLHKRKTLKSPAIHAKSSCIGEDASFAKELFCGNMPYTLRSLSNAFSIPADQINIVFVERKRALCCSNLDYLLSQYAFSETLRENIESVHQRYHLNFGKEDLPVISKEIEISFDALSNMAMKAIQRDSPDFEFNRMLLGGLSHFKNQLIKEIDETCQKIELTNHYLRAVQNSRQLQIN